MKSLELKINGMTCHHCIKAVEVKLSELGVESHHVDINKAIVKFDENKISERDVYNAIDDAGYKVAR
jgi:copper ion binding protein